MVRTAGVILPLFRNCCKIWQHLTTHRHGNEGTSGGGAGRDGAHGFRRLPFDVKVPDPATLEAIGELEAGKGRRFETPEDLLADLGVRGSAGLQGPAARVRSGRRRA